MIYDAPSVRLCYDGPGATDGPLTFEQAKKLLGWEPKDDYLARRKREDPRLTDAEVLKNFDEDHAFILKDMEDIEVACWNNHRNRPFDRTWALKLTQEHLNRRWRMNFENVIIGRTGLVESAQHRLVGFAFACQLWLKGGAFRECWPDGPPTYPTSVALGADESHETIATLDQTKPRTLADTIFTSEEFADIKTSSDRKLLSRMLDQAIDTLWVRVGVGTDPLHKYQTHAESQDFLARHAKLKRCVRHLFQENKSRALSLLRLSPGQCAAACYLMGATDSDRERYENHPDDEHCVWKQEKKAREFFAELAAGRLNHVADALGKLVAVGGGVGARSVEKLAILAKAWAVYVGGDEVTPGSIGVSKDQPTGLEYRLDERGRYVLDEWPTFGGIDLGPSAKQKQEATEGEADETESAGEAVPPTPEEIEARKAAIREEALAEAQKKIADANAQREEKKAKLLADRATRKPRTLKGGTT